MQEDREAEVRLPPRRYPFYSTAAAVDMIHLPPPAPACNHKVPYAGLHTYGSRGIIFLPHEAVVAEVSEVSPAKDTAQLARWRPRLASSWKEDRRWRTKLWMSCGSLV